MKRFFSFIAILLVLFQPVVSAKERPPIYPGFPTLRESKAYKKFVTRTYSEFSKILYLIDRYSEANIMINYEDQNYTAAFSTTVARWFLSRNYKKQTAREWIKQWCSKTIFQNKPIFVKLPDGKFILAREILETEVGDLEQAVKENQNQTVPPAAAAAEVSSSPSPAPIVSVVDANLNASYGEKSSELASVQVEPKMSKVVGTTPTTPAKPKA